jgi:hypothetical protein
MSFGLYARIRDLDHRPGLRCPFNARSAALDWRNGNRADRARDSIRREGDPPERSGLIAVW